MSMTYFTDSSPLAFALLILGTAVALASVAASVRTVTFRTGSPAAVADRMSFRVAGIAGAALMAVGVTPLLITAMSF